jgi:hypothetical protein
MITIEMHFRWITAALLVILLTTAPVDSQKRRKGERKKESEATTAAPKVEVKQEGGGGGGRRSGRHTTTTTTTTPPTTLAVAEEEVEEEIQITNESRSPVNVCPPELKPQEGKILPCTCRDELDENALMIECVALTSAQQMHKIFNVIVANISL